MITLCLVKKVPAWIETLLVKLKKWAKEGWRSSFVKMTHTTANTTRYVALIRNEQWKENFTVSDDDDLSSINEEEDPVSRKKVALIAN